MPDAASPTTADAASPTIIRRERRPVSAESLLLQLRLRLRRHLRGSAAARGELRKPARASSPPRGRARVGANTKTPRGRLPHRPGKDFADRAPDVTTVALSAPRAPTTTDCLVRRAVQL